MSRSISRRRTTPQRSAPRPAVQAAGPLRASALLLAAVLLFCACAHWGQTYPRFVARSWQAWRATRGVSLEERRQQLYDDTYPVLLYLREFLPPDARVLLPPVELIRDRHQGDIPLLASPTSAYSFLYPRIPVHHGQPSPFMDRITHVLVWEHWGLEYVAPGAAPTDANRIGLYDWPAGMEVRW